ncbi:hypothetical protein CFK37_12195 [Virgibacillus phasianinus]|uniref:PPM-type phosphatase domain-containing protein n=1 Tax=Virgibacillus phasianinus TaxID=2017483 RepID=A0A220U3J2_9BACI|nr:PP2C family serine/threonine-protein phosphatase [Virgibacillus phasianinus]ASK62854.1 hypothetical protein CFK37_12195 [Virgibacillus phasianinus]
MNKRKEIYPGHISEKGPEKPVNEDFIEFTSSSIDFHDDAHILIIADGMGGHAFGDVASFYAGNYILKWWRAKLRKNKTSEEFLKDCQDSIVDIFCTINQKLIEIGHREDSNLGTTLSVLLFVGGKYLICHVGDSRIYRLSKKIYESTDNDETFDLNQSKAFVQLTKDHSWAKMQVENGNMSEQEAENHEKAHILTQCMGIKGNVDPFVSMGTYTEDDHFFMCTDGLYALLTNEIINEQWSKKLNEKLAAQDIANHFFELAKDAEYHDDVSIMIVDSMGV